MVDNNRLTSERIITRKSRLIEQERRTIAERERTGSEQYKTQEIIRKYGIDIRKYESDSNYKINRVGDEIVSITQNSTSYNIEVNERFYDDKPTTTTTKNSTYQPEKIVFENGRAVKKEYYIIDKANYEHDKNSRGIYSREIEYAPRLSKVEYYNETGQVIQSDSYKLRIATRRTGSSSLGITYTEYMSGTKDFVAGTQQTFAPQPAKNRSYKDNVKVIQQIGGKTYTVSIPTTRLKAGDKIVSSTGKITTFNPSKWTENDVRNILAATEQTKEMKDKDLIAQILNSKSLQNQLLKKISGVYSEEAEFLQAKKKFLTEKMFNKYFSGKFVLNKEGEKIPIEVYKEYKKNNVNLIKETLSKIIAAIKSYINIVNIKNTLFAKQQTAADKKRIDEIGKWVYLEQVFKSISKKVQEKNKQKQLLREAKLAMVSVSGLFMLSDIKNKEIAKEIYNKHYKNKEVSYFNVKTGEGKIVVIEQLADGTLKAVEKDVSKEGKIVRVRKYKINTLAKPTERVRRIFKITGTTLNTYLSSFNKGLNKLTIPFNIETIKLSTNNKLSEELLKKGLKLSSPVNLTIYAKKIDKYIANSKKPFSDKDINTVMKTYATILAYQTGLKLLPVSYMKALFTSMSTFNVINNGRKFYSNPTITNLANLGLATAHNIIVLGLLYSPIRKQSLNRLQKTRNRLYKKYTKETNVKKLKKLEEAIVKTEATIVQLNKKLTVKQLDKRIVSIRKQLQKGKIPELQRQMQRKELKVLTSKQKQIQRAEVLVGKNNKQLALSKRGLSNINTYMRNRNSIYELIDGTISSDITKNILKKVNKQDKSLLKNLRSKALKAKTKATKIKWRNILNASKKIITNNKMLLSKKAQVSARGKRKTTKAQLRKNTFNQAYDPRITKTKDAIYIKGKKTKEYTSFLEGKKGQRIKVRKGKVEFKDVPTKRGDTVRVERVIVARKHHGSFSFEKAIRILEPTRTTQRKLYQPGKGSQAVDRKSSKQRDVEFTSSILDKSSGRVDVLFKQSILKGKPLKISYEKRIARTKNIKTIKNDRTILFQDLNKGKLSKPTSSKPVIQQINRNNIPNNKGFRSSRSRNQLYERLNKLKEQRRKEINKAKQQPQTYQKQFIKKSPYKNYKYAFNKQTHAPVIYWNTNNFNFLQKGDLSFGFLTRKKTPYYYNVEKVHTPSKEVMIRIFGSKGIELFKDYVNVVAIQPLGKDNLLMEKSLVGEFVKSANKNFNNLINNAFKHGYYMNHQKIAGSKTLLNSKFMFSQMGGAKFFTASLLNSALLYGRQIMSINKTEFDNMLKKDTKTNVKIKTKVKTKQIHQTKKKKIITIIIKHE
ncbi:MAG: hypothetical protein D4S01_09015, partial [Dehalococcoidia bacterium]